jgi:hypothetical protein
MQGVFMSSFSNMKFWCIQMVEIHAKTDEKMTTNASSFRLYLAGIRN